MRDSKHTQGPWQVLKIAKPMTITGNVHQITDQDRYPSAFVPAWDNPGPGEKDGTDEALANARLIAASPDLLEALKLAVLDVTAMTFNTRDRRSKAILNDRLKSYEAVIAKAEGR